jgi:hypothetical protein|nr:MAG TPA: Mycobacterial 2 TMS Phage Holin (M2 Hol) Family [Caudoviricetes sp.]
MIEKILSPKGRTYLYSVGIAIIALLTTYGLMTQELASAWSALLAPLFGLAIAHVPSEGEDNND